MPRGFDLKVDPEVIRDMYWNKNMTCAAIGAEVGITGSGVWVFMKRHKIPVRPRYGLRGPQWKPRHRSDQTPLGGTFDKAGYVWMRIGRMYPGADKRGYILRSRYVWQEATGEVLRRTDIIHHRNENKQDDRFENLQRVTLAEHMAIHARIRKQKKEAEGMLA